MFSPTTTMRTALGISGNFATAIWTFLKIHIALHSLNLKHTEYLELLP